jgi:hypothetical protein
MYISKGFVRYRFGMARCTTHFYGCVVYFSVAAMAGYTSANRFVGVNIGSVGVGKNCVKRGGNFPGNVGS